MFRNYLVTALRNITRHRLYSFINICGLAIGLACVIFVILFVRDELSYDKWIPDTKNLYRVEVSVSVPGRDPLSMAVVPFAMPAAMRDAIPEVTGMTRFNPSAMTLMVGDRKFLEQVTAVDPDFFTIVKLPLLRGDPNSVFQNPESLVLSESAARKYFGTTDVVGKIVATTANCGVSDETCQGRMISLRVTGVMRDIPHNSQFEGDVFLPNTSVADRNSKEAKLNWHIENGFGYVRLVSGSDPQVVIAKMAPILDRNVTGELTASGKALKGSQAYSVHLTPFTDVHLTSDRWRFNNKPPGSWTTVCGVIIVGLLILSVACFNFTNLATARGMLRAREIALRKTLGANRGQLIVQFLVEAVLMALLALVLALALVEVLQPAFSDFLQHPLGLSYANDWSLLLFLVVIAIAAGLAGGSYPALVLSGFRPASVLRASTGQAGSGRFRNILVVVQFAVSIGLGIAAAVVFTQINFARNIDLGFRKDNILVVRGAGLLTIEGREGFVQQLRSNPNILDIAMTSVLPFDSSQMTSSVQLVGHPEYFELNERVIGANAVQLLGMKLVAGRLLSDRRAQDQVDESNRGDIARRNDGHNVLIDEAAAARLGLTPQQAVGKVIIFQRKSHLNIVGVLADAKFGGAREPAKASVYLYDPKFTAAAMIRIRPDNMPETLSFIDRAWRNFAPTKAMQRYFLDDVFGKLYQADERQGRMFGLFVLVAIFIACLGLFGLAAFTVGRRTREIGIRKVFGAHTRDLVFLLLWQFSIPVIIANAIAWPVAWYYLQDWLQGFAYRVPLSPLYFLGAGAVALLVAWATVFVHARRVAGANPIHALRYE
jgi:putative ABC transport system permease protein